MMMGLFGDHQGKLELQSGCSLTWHFSACKKTDGQN